MTDDDPTLVDPDALDRVRSAYGDVSLPDPAELVSFETDAINAVFETIAARDERELRAAWRAGYDRLDVYKKSAPLGRNPGQVTLDRTYVPRRDVDPRRDPSGWQYAFSYDLTSVPDDVIRDALDDA